MNLRVLVMNEQDLFCHFLSDLLAAEGHVAFCARGFSEASQTAALHKPDLIILEVSRPEIGALEVVQRLQRGQETGLTPIIVISDYADLEYEFLNVFDFIPKPVDVMRLRQDLKMLGEGRKKRTQAFKIEPFTTGDHQLFYDYLITHSGLHFERRNIKILEKALTARMAALQIGSYRDYFDFLTRHSKNRQELQKLMPFLTVGETYFFRYHSHFDTLRAFIRNEFAANRGRRIRLWSAGCSTGEEAYSIAMTVMEALPDWRKRDIRILATDIDNRALKKARDGVYGSWAMRVIEQSYLDRYFDKVGKSYIMRKDVKGLVEFSHLNLQADEFPAGDFKDLDVIFCRNVMIYFTLPTTRKIVDKLASTLVPGGLLFLGHAETLFQISSRFERHAHDGGFYYRLKKGRGTPLQQQQIKPPAVVVTPAREMKPVRVVVPASKAAAPVPASSGPDAEQLFTAAQALFDAEKYREASALLVEILRQMPRHAGALVMQGFVSANNSDFEHALKLCQEALHINDLLPEAYFLKGLVLDMTDRTEEAVVEYRKAILLKMDFVSSHYYLGRLYLRLGRESDGARELKNTLKILEKEREETIVPYSGGLSREVFLQQVRDELAKAA